MVSLTGHSSTEVPTAKYLQLKINLSAKLCGIFSVRTLLCILVLHVPVVYLPLSRRLVITATAIVVRPNIVFVSSRRNTGCPRMV